MRHMPHPADEVELAREGQPRVTRHVQISMIVIWRNIGNAAAAGQAHAGLAIILAKGDIVQIALLIHLRRPEELLGLKLGQNLRRARRETQVDQSIAHPKSLDVGNTKRTPILHQRLTDRRGETRPWRISNLAQNQPGRDQGRVDALCPHIAIPHLPRYTDADKFVN